MNAMLDLMAELVGNKAVESAAIAWVMGSRAGGWTPTTGRALPGGSG